MKPPVPKPDYSNAGPKRDAAAFLARRPVARAVLADTATAADSATVSSAVDPVSPRGTLDDTAVLALLTDDDRIEPLTIADFLAYLETKYVLTPIP